MNAFEVLGLEPRPLPDADAIKAAHLRAMAVSHPDASGSHEAALRLNRARGILDNDRARILHLLEISGGKPQSAHGAVPQAIGDLFAGIADLLARARDHLRNAAAADSALEKAALLPAAWELHDGLRNFQDRIRTLREEQIAALRACDRAWTLGQHDQESLQRIALALAFLDRWSEQVEEQAFRLSETLL